MKKPFSASRAYLIGIADYLYPEWQLKTPLHDMRALESLLHNQHGFEVTALANPTAEMMWAFFQRIGQEVRAVDERVFIYYAGHGVQRDSVHGLKGYFVPADAHPDREDSMVSMEAISKIINGLPARHILLVLDCCFAGTFRMLGQRSIGSRGPNEQIRRQHYDIFCNFPSRLLLTSTSYRQKAFDRVEDTAANSPFNRFLCRALEGDADYTRNRLVTPSELKTYLTDNISKITEYAGNLQSVGLDALEGDGEGEFLFFLDGFNVAQLPEQAYVNPYKGLQSYDQGDAALFFGRQKATQALLEKAKTCPFIIVIGASGTGKSSLVKAGLLPRLSGQRIFVIRPGKNPMASLPSNNAWDVLTIDQWEEIVTQATDPAEVEQFYIRIRHLLDSGKRIIGTVRADFEAQTRHNALDPYWTQGRFVVPSFTSEEYHDIIVQPAKRVACLFEDRDLVQQIEQEVTQQPGPLPLLSFMLSELFERAKSESARYREIKRRHYETVGGVSGALRNKAEEVFAVLPDTAHRDTMRRLMLRMVALSAGEMAGRRVFLDELESHDNSEGLRMQTVIQYLDEAKLIRLDADDKGKRYMEPAHDALVRAWRRLWDWVKELGEENLLLHAKIMGAVSDYHAKQNSKEFLWAADARLEQSNALMLRDPLLLNALERSFTELSMHEKNRRTRRIRMLVAGVILGLTGLSGVTWWQRGEAQHQAQIAEKNLADFVRADSIRLAEEAAKERLNFDQFVREGDTYLASQDYNLAKRRYLKADSLILRFPNDPNLIKKSAALREKIRQLETVKISNLKQ